MRKVFIHISFFDILAEILSEGGEEGGEDIEIDDGPLEKPQDPSYSIYSSHAYKILPFDDKNGKRKFKVTNPWNQSHAVIMTLNKVKQFFQDLAIAKVAPEGKHNGEARKA